MHIFIPSVAKISGRIFEDRIFLINFKYKSSHNLDPCFSYIFKIQIITLP